MFQSLTALANWNWRSSFVHISRRLLLPLFCSSLGILWLKGSYPQRVQKLNTSSVFFPSVKWMESQAVTQSNSNQFQRSSASFLGGVGIRAHWCLTLCDPVDGSLPGSSVYGISQARIVEWVAIFSSRGPSWPRDRTLATYVSCIGRWILYHRPYLWSNHCKRIHWLIWLTSLKHQCYARDWGFRRAGQSPFPSLWQNSKTHML